MYNELNRVCLFHCMMHRWYQGDIQLSVFMEELWLLHFELAGVTLLIISIIQPIECHSSLICCGEWMDQFLRVTLR